MLVAGECCPEASDGVVDTCGGEVANDLASLLDAPILSHRFRTDLVDVSRSLNHPKLFGKIAKSWSASRKQQLIDIAYQPFRDDVEAALGRVLQQYTFVIHLSVRSFASQQGGKRRRTDVGLLYDPARRDEMDLCADWVDELYFVYPHLRVRRNYPRRGTVDSLTKSMRGRFSADLYMGVEVWVNRAWAARRVRLRDEALTHFAEALRQTIDASDAEAA
ncbi:MAG: hypothetical protein KDB00_21175 [Planctomycetales bacterium]|nr:hypothetical protein [Planctomycetales bacterium]